MKTIIHVYPSRREALDDMSKVNDPEAIVNFPVMFIDFLKERIDIYQRIYQEV